MSHSASAFSDRRPPVQSKACLRIVDINGMIADIPRASAIRYLAVQTPGDHDLVTTLFRTWRTADVAGNGCGRCHQCSAVHYGDGLSACGLPHAGPIGDGAEALDFSPDGL